MFTEDDFIMISALQHYIFCPRQCGLIHVEDAWQENLFTVRGNILHEKVDTNTYGTRGNVKTVRGLRIHSKRLGIVGRCDVVEFSQDKNGNEKILPVEFKSGKPKENISDKVQLCGQVLCLEEMISTNIYQAAFFYGKIRRRIKINIDETLRSQTEEVISSVHNLVRNKLIPSAEYTSKCRSCSLINLCQPKAMNIKKLRNYLTDLYSE